MSAGNTCTTTAFRRSSSTWRTTRKSVGTWRAIPRTPLAWRGFEARLRTTVDPEAVEAEAKAAQRRLVERNGGEAALRAAGPRINFTRAPEQFR